MFEEVCDGGCNEGSSRRGHPRFCILFGCSVSAQVFSLYLCTNVCNIFSPVTSFDYVVRRVGLGKLGFHSSDACG